MATPIKGQYVLDYFLGRGGMAEVFAGRKIGAAGFTRRVAIKRILPGYYLEDRFRTMFVAEAQLGARLDHDNIVSILDFEEDEAGGLFLVMELVDGIDLNGLLRTGSLPLPVALFIASEVLQGLAHAHDLPVGDDGLRGLVHRDVSPQNVLLSWEGAVKVSDFGIAKARHATHASGSVRAKGKPGYLSPEYANGLDLDGRSDLFAVGVLLWEMQIGEPLFSRASETASLMSLLFEPYPSPRSKRPEVPTDVEAVTMRLLAKDREDRYFTAKAALGALRDCAAFPKRGDELLSSLLVERLPDRAPRRYGGRATRLDVPAVSVLESAPQRPAAARSVRPRAMRSAILGAAVAASAAIATSVILHDSGSGAAVGPPSSAAPLTLPGSRAAVNSPPSTAPPTLPAPRRVPSPSAPPVDERSSPARGMVQLPNRSVDPASTQPVDRRPRPTPVPAQPNRGGILVIDLGSSQSK